MHAQIQSSIFANVKALRAMAATCFEHRTKSIRLSKQNLALIKYKKKELLNRCVTMKHEYTVTQLSQLNGQAFASIFWEPYRIIFIDQARSSMVLLQVIGSKGRRDQSQAKLVGQGLFTFIMYMYNLIFIWIYMDMYI